VAREKEHQRAAFETWYSEFDCCFLKTADSLGVARKTVHAWANAFDWRGRAAARDLERQKQSERAAVKRQVKLIERQRDAGAALRVRGVQWLSENKITKGSDAIKAIQVGIEMERQAEGLPDWVFSLQSMSEDELQAELARQSRLARAQDEGDSDGACGETEDEAAAAGEE
jgi:hypothetical protein